MVSDTLTHKGSTIIINSYGNKNDSIINCLSHNLTKRIDDIQNIDYKFWFPIVVTILLAIINWIIVDYSYRKDKKRSILSNISQEYNAAESEFIKISKNETDKDIINYHLEVVLNIIENMCYEYCKKNVVYADFNHRFKNKIIEYYRMFPEYYGDISEYYSTIKYYEKII